MSLNEIILQSAQLSDWYGTQLVAAGTQAAGSSTELKPALLGDYAKRTLIVIDERSHTYLSDPDLNFLTGILGACKLTLGDVGILNIHAIKNPTASWILDQYEPAVCWVFGTDNIEMGWGGIAPRIQRVFTAPPLHELSANPEAKRRLWLALKEHYGV